MITSLLMNKTYIYIYIYIYIFNINELYHDVNFINDRQAFKHAQFMHCKYAIFEPFIKVKNRN